MLDQVTRMLPVDRARGVLLPPVRILREGAVIVARTARHWEIVLAGEDPRDGDRWQTLVDSLKGGRGLRTTAGVRQQEGSWGRESHAGAASDHGTRSDGNGESDGSFSSAAMAAASSQEQPAEGRTDIGDDARVVDLTDLTPGDLPVEGWPEMSYADAQARVSGLDEDELQMLLSYERSHGHRPLFEQLLDNRITADGAHQSGEERNSSR